MVHGVAAAGGHLLVVHLELGGGLLQPFGIAAQGDEAGVEGGHVLAQDLGRVALGIDGDEDHLQLVAVGAEQALRFHRAGQRGGAHVGALHEAEVQQHQLAAVVGQRALLAVHVGQAEVAAVGGAGDVDAAKAGLLAGGLAQLVAGRERRAAECGQRHTRKARQRGTARRVENLGWGHAALLQMLNEMRRQRLFIKRGQLQKQ